MPAELVRHHSAPAFHPVLALVLCLIVGNSLIATPDLYSMQNEIKQEFMVGKPLRRIAPQPGSTTAISVATATSEEILAQRGVQPTKESLSRFLRAMLPTKKAISEATHWINQLGSPHFQDREEATKQLSKTISLPVDLLKSVASSNDPEASFRAKSVLELNEIEINRSLKAVLDLIERKPITGLASELLEVYPIIKSPSLLYDFQRSLAATIQSSDRELLQKELRHSQEPRRLNAVFALSQVFGEEFDDQFAQIASDSSNSEALQLRAAKELASHQDRRCLETYARLLSSDESSTRANSAGMLRRLTQKSFGFSAFEVQSVRESKADLWRDWLASNPPDVQNFPRNLFQLNRVDMKGHLLLALGYKNQVIEYDSKGDTVWSFKATGAWMAEKLLNGNTLIAAHGANMLIVVDDHGKEVWRHLAPSIISAHQLENGNYLMAQHTTKQVTEITQEGKIVWQYETRENCCDAHRLGNGNTLLCAGNEVVEVTREKKVVWSYQSSQCYGISPLDSGNLLICELPGAVIELDPQSKTVVWRYQCKQPVDAYRLNNGNTLITTGKNSLEVTQDHVIVWQSKESNFGSARK